MGRLSARLKDSAIDRLVQGAVSSAHRSVAQAIQAVRRTKASPGVSLARLRRVERDLARVAAALSQVGSVANPFESDSDSMSEDDRSALFWDARKAEREEAERLAALEVPNAPEDEDGEPVPAPVQADVDDEGGE